MTVRILQGDCRDILPTLDECSVDSIVTDPPYHLTTGKRGGTGAASVNLKSPAGRARITAGFMGQAWDGGDVAFRPETWAAVLRVAKPGAYLAAFGGTRTFHRLACAIEDAGWELRDTLMWVYGSGFPKSHNGPWGGTALKPAWEPIILARKPLEGTVEANWRKWGTGALNIDGCRIATSDVLLGSGQPPLSFRGENARPFHNREGEASKDRRYADSGGTNFAATPGPRGGDPSGRWPANVLHDGSDEVLSAFPDAPGQQGDLTGNEPSAPFKNAYGVIGRAPAPQARGDAGSAARFFYCAKASRADRDEGLDGMPADMVHGPSADGRCWDIPGCNSRPRSNTHPTVKPTDLMRWLCRLVTPAGGIPLDPFMGSGSTGKAALRENMGFIGIELDEHYCAIAARRIHADAPLFAGSMP